MLDRRALLASTLAGAVFAALPRRAFAQAPKMPFKLFDCHAHFYTNQPDKYPFDAHTARYGAERMIAKAMATPTTPEVIFKFWDAAGIERGLGVQYSSTYFTDNRYLLDIAAQYPDRITPIVILDPVGAETPATLAKFARENKIAGVRWTGSPDATSKEFVFFSAAAEQAWAACNDLGLTITLMPLGADNKTPMKLVAEKAQKYPNVRIVLDHIGFPRYAEAPETFGYAPEHLALPALKNVYYKYTTLLIEQLQEAKAPLQDFMAYTAETFGADHMVWGSDIGNSEGGDMLFLQHALDSAGKLTPAQQKLVFSDTARSLFVPGGRGKA